jgi:ATP/maltotriose-dependent transcriptional regulator MalT
VARKPLALAKLSRPRQSGVLPRPRLFALIDAARAAKAVWISGLPGAGKTTLVASYLEAKKSPGIWYQIDAGDSDPASFVYFLAQAAKSRLALLEPEYQKDLEGFARRFFRQLFSAAGKGWTLALDNYHELDPASPVHAMLRCAVEEMPAGINTIVVSRTEAPAEFARLVMSQQLQRIDWRELAFNRDETSAFAELRGAAERAEALHEHSRGWAAALVLLANRSSGDSRAFVVSDATETIFDYFAEEIFAKAEPALREFLMRTSFLPRFTESSAAGISGDSRSAELLAGLYRGHLFVDRRDEPEAVYQYHDLFRAFLQRRALEHYSAEQIAALRRHAGRLLEQSSQAEDAFTLHIAAGDVAAASALVARSAEPLLAQGRGQTLRSWIAALPDDYVANSPRLQYLWGLCLVAIDQREARLRLEQAHAGFLAQGDTAGQILAAAGIIDSIACENANCALLDDCIPRMEGLVPMHSEVLAPRDRLRVYSGLFFALMQRRPKHPLLPFCRDRVRALIAEDFDPNLRLSCGRDLLTYCNLAGDVGLFDEVRRTIAPLLRLPGVSQLYRAAWHVRLAFFMSLLDIDEAQKTLDEARAIASAQGVVSVEDNINFTDFLCAQIRHDYVRAAALLERWKSATRAVPVDVVVWHLASCSFAYSQGDLRAALQHSRTALENAERSGTLLIATTSTLTRCALLAETGEFAEVDARLARLRERCYGSPLLRNDAQIDTTQAYVELQRGDVAAAAPLLERVFGLARAHHIPGTLGIIRLMPTAETRIVEAALRLGIEVPFVQGYIRQRGLTSERPDVPNWPWPVKVFALGRFQVLRDDKPIATGQKAQRKPLELLAALVARGGHDVPTATIATDLWPDAEGDAAQASFEASLHRLRKLIGRPDTIQLHDGKLSLDARQCWADVWAFERLCAAEDTAAIDLYAGQFLASEPERPWMLAPRERLRDRFIRLALKLGEQSEEKGDPQAARQLYERALEIDNLAELVYQRLMRCHMRRGQRAEAMRLYRRCRELLEIGLGVPPAPETQALYNELRAAESEIR